MELKQHYKLPKPTGSYHVGCMNLWYEYEGADAKRQLPCLCYYPAKDIAHEQPRPYVDERILHHASGIATHTYSDAPIADGEFPLLLYNHGPTLFHEINTIQHEALASHGYIVLCVGHEGQGSYVLPDGGILPVQLARNTFEPPTALATFFRYAWWVKAEGTTASMEEHRHHYPHYLEASPHMITLSNMWMKDTLIALDQFLREIEQLGSRFNHHVDIGHIGIFGYSFGGSTALNVSLGSERITVVADLDGYFYSPQWEQPVEKPGLFLQNESTPVLTFPFFNATGDAYLVTVKGTQHGNFCDFGAILAKNQTTTAMVDDQEVELSVLGAAEPLAVEEIINTLLLDFFEKYLKGKDSQVLDAQNTPEGIDVRKKLDGSPKTGSLHSP
jgi:hypothetical protein